MLERLRDTVSALKIDSEMVKTVRSGVSGRLTAGDWGDECVLLATTRRTGQIDASIFYNLSPAAKDLLPKVLIIK